MEHGDKDAKQNEAQSMCLKRNFIIQKYFLGSKILSKYEHCITML